MSESAHMNDVDFAQHVTSIISNPRHVSWTLACCMVTEAKRARAAEKDLAADVASLEREIERLTRKLEMWDQLITVVQEAPHDPECRRYSGTTLADIGRKKCTCWKSDPDLVEVMK